MFMSNHFHLIVRAPHRNLSVFMQYFQQNTTRHLNIIRERSGTVFGKRFHSVPIESDEHMINALRYIYANPIEDAGVHPDDWAGFSSWGLLKQNLPLALDLRSLCLPSLRKSQEILAASDKKNLVYDGSRFEGVMGIRLDRTVHPQRLRHLLDSQFLARYGKIKRATPRPSSERSKPDRSHKAKPISLEVHREQLQKRQRQREVEEAYRRACVMRRRGHVNTVFPEGTIPPFERLNIRRARVCLIGPHVFIAGMCMIYVHMLLRRPPYPSPTPPCAPGAHMKVLCAQECVQLDAFRSLRTLWVDPDSLDGSRARRRGRRSSSQRAG